MPEERTFFTGSEEWGSTSFSEIELINMIASAVLEINGVAMLGNGVGRDRTSVYFQKNVSRAIRVSQSGDGLIIDIYVVLISECSIKDVANAIQDAVLETLDVCNVQCNVQINAINVIVDEEEYES